LLLLPLFLTQQVWAQGRSVEALSSAMKSGNASAVARFFGPTVDLTINNSSSTYSRTQAEQVLREFFSRNQVRDFDVDYSGNSTSSNSSFTIGSLQTGTCKFKVYMLLRPADGGFVLKELRIEK
jgi:hypothetical protein